MLGYRYCPANDRFADATKLSGTKGKKVSSNAGAGRQSKEPRTVAGQQAGQSVWYVYRAKRSRPADHRPVRLEVQHPARRLHRQKITKLHQVAADDNAGKGRSSRVSFPVAKGTKYRILVAGVKTAEGKFIPALALRQDGVINARRDARRNVVSTAGPSTAIATAVVIARPVSKLPVEVSSV